MAKKKNDLFETSNKLDKTNFDQDKEIAAKLVAVHIQEIERLGMKRQMSLDDIIKSYNYCLQKLKEKSFTAGELRDFISSKESSLKKTKPFFDFSAKKQEKQKKEINDEEMSQDALDETKLDDNEEDYDESFDDEENLDDLEENEEKQ